MDTTAHATNVFMNCVCYILYGCELCCLRTLLVIVFSKREYQLYRSAFWALQPGSQSVGDGEAVVRDDWNEMVVGIYLCGS